MLDRLWKLKLQWHEPHFPFHDQIFFAIPHQEEELVNQQYECDGALFVSLKCLVL